MTTVFFIPTVILMGAGCLGDAARTIRSQGSKKALVVTDASVVQSGTAQKVCDQLAAHGVQAVIFADVQPNPTAQNVADGLALLRANACDFVISLGGSPHDCAKEIALVATNGGAIQDYEGLDQSAQPQLPLVTIHTMAETVGEMRRLCIITDEARHVNMAIVDKHTTPVLSVNDTELMLPEPAGSIAAGGMKALTHAVEAHVSPIATPVNELSRSPAKAFNTDIRPLGSMGEIRAIFPVAM